MNRRAFLAAAAVAPMAPRDLVAPGLEVVEIPEHLRRALIAAVAQMNVMGHAAGDYVFFAGDHDDRA